MSVSTKGRKPRPKKTNHVFFLEDVLQIIADARLQYQREEDQGLLNHKFEDARMAMAARDACDRLKREFQWYAEHPSHLESVADAPERERPPKPN